MSLFKKNKTLKNIENENLSFENLEKILIVKKFENLDTESDMDVESIKSSTRDNFNHTKNIKNLSTTR